MSMVRFATLCDTCQRRSPEFEMHPSCEECGQHVCERCLLAHGCEGPVKHNVDRCECSACHRAYQLSTTCSSCKQTMAECQCCSRCYSLKCQCDDRDDYREVR